MSFSSNIFLLKQLSDKNDIDDINNNLYLNDNIDIKNAVDTWENIIVKTQWSDESISNSDVQEEFLVRLIIKLDQDIYERSDIYHEGLRRNILFVDKKFDEKEIISLANKSTKYTLAQKGIFGDISHDVLNKVEYFSNFNEEKVTLLKELNNRCKIEFEDSFNKLMQNKKLEAQPDTLNKLYTELNELYLASISHDKHLGSSKETLEYINKTIENIINR